MRYRVTYTTAALRQLKKLDTSTRTMILAYVEKNLDACENPRAVGTTLTGQFAGMWRYRVGNYRLLAQIVDEEITIDIIKIGHRSTVYKS